MTPRTWTCQRQSGGVKCRTVNPKRKHLCEACGKRRPATKAPAHMAALNAPYAEWVERYGEACGICGRAPKSGRKLHRDHDHRTGAQRGLLCFPCNSGLRVYMTLEWLLAAVAYLKRTEA